MPKEEKMSFFAAVLLSVNIMVGAGILYAVGPMTAAAGSISFLGWPLAGLLLFPVIWSVAKAAELFPGAGGFYHYCSSGINPMAGFIAHWGYILAYLSVASALLTLLRNGIIQNLNLTFVKEYPIFLNMILVSIYTAINLLPVNKINKIQSIATILKIMPLIMVIALMAFYFNSSLTFNFAELGRIGMTISTVIFAYIGFEACCSIGGLLKDGPKKVPSVILTGFFVTLALYSLFHFGLLYIMGPENLATYGAIAFPRFLGLPPILETVLQMGISGTVLFIWANSILGVSIANITNIHSLAQKKLIFADKILAVTDRNQRPVYIVFAHGLAIFVIVTLTSNVDLLVALTNIGVIIVFVLILVALFLARLRQKNYTQLAVTLVAFASCSIFIYYSLITMPGMIYALPLILGMIAGIVMFKIKTKGRGKMGKCNFLVKNEIIS